MGCVNKEVKQNKTKLTSQGVKNILLLVQTNKFYEVQILNYKNNYIFALT